MLEERHGHVAGAAAEIKRHGLRMLEDRLKEAGGAGPPGTVDADGEEMIGAVVGGGDGVEHLLHICGRFPLGGDAGRSGSGGALVFRLCLLSTHS